MTLVSHIQIRYKQSDGKAVFELGTVFYARIILHLQPVCATELIRLLYRLRSTE